MIGFCLAAQHPGLFGHMAIIVAAYTMTEAAKEANLESARLLSAGRKTDAAAAWVTFLYPGLRVPWVTRLLAAVVARVSFAAAYDPSDVLVTATALMPCSRSPLPSQTSVPAALSHAVSDCGRPLSGRVVTVIRPDAVEVIRHPVRARTQAAPSRPTHRRIVGRTPQDRWDRP